MKGNLEFLNEQIRKWAEGKVGEALLYWHPEEFQVGGWRSFEGTGHMSKGLAFTPHLSQFVLSSYDSDHLEGRTVAKSLKQVKEWFGFYDATVDISENLCDDSECKEHVGAEPMFYPKSADNDKAAIVEPARLPNMIELLGPNAQIRIQEETKVCYLAMTAKQHFQAIYKLMNAKQSPDTLTQVFACNQAIAELWGQVPEEFRGTFESVFCEYSKESNRERALGYMMALKGSGSW